MEKNNIVSDEEDKDIYQNLIKLMSQANEGLGIPLKKSTLIKLKELQQKYPNANPVISASISEYAKGLESRLNIEVGQLKNQIAKLKELLQKYPNADPVVSAAISEYTKILEEEIR